MGGLSTTNTGRKLTFTIRTSFTSGSSQHLAFQHTKHKAATLIQKVGRGFLAWSRFAACRGILSVEPEKNWYLGYL